MLQRFSSLIRWFPAFGILLLAGPISSSLHSAGDPETPSDFTKTIQPILKSKCYRCHHTERKRGGVDLTVFKNRKTVLEKLKVWKRVLKQVETGQMPPDREPPLSKDHQALIAGWIKDTLNSIAVAEPGKRDPGPTLIRRLSRAEYNYTIRDLFQVDFDVATAVGMPDDAVEHSFDNAAGSLGISPVMMEKYYSAAELVLKKIIPDNGKRPKKKRGTAANRDELGQAYDAIFLVKGKDDVPEKSPKDILSRFLRRAFRRPVTGAEISRYHSLFQLARTKGKKNFAVAMRTALKAALLSPHFLFRLEQPPRQDSTRVGLPVDEHALAVRLSYFVWSSMPDEELFRLADQGKLSDPEIYEQQVKRMLADPKSKSLTDIFAEQWLQIRKLKDARPTIEFFPTFKPRLRRAMFSEVMTFFDNLRKEDRTILELLQADYTFVDRELARHYNLKNFDSREMKRIKLNPDKHRGGITTMAGVLTLSSHASRTSPTSRGKWILEVILGDPPPPPPPDAGMLKEEEKGKEAKSFRERMAQHASQPSCAGCHSKIDPLGFGLENFDAIGRWRNRIGNDPIDTSGELPSGEKFNGPDELRKILWKRKDEFVRNLTEKMLIYALGREVHYYDEPAVREILRDLQQNNYRFSRLILGVAKSFPFKNQRTADKTK